MKKVDYTGQKFGRWTVIKRGKRIGNKLTWECKCECGNKRNVLAGTLAFGGSKSCGCYTKERLTKHGQNTGTYTSPEYVSWLKMKQRCLNPNDVAYHNYGGRGIIISDEWLDFQNFYKDLGDKPSKEHTIDRINNDGNYEKDNCKWSTKHEQSSNRRKLTNNTSGTTGVMWNSQCNKWQATITSKGKHYHLGIYNEIEEAIEARSRAETKHKVTSDEVKIK